jgi:hypothetical protein
MGDRRAFNWTRAVLPSGSRIRACVIDRDMAETTPARPLLVDATDQSDDDERRNDDE